jgi:type III pantothenate kinase
LNHMKLSQYLLIDIGNSRMKWATAGVHDTIRPEGELATAEATSERIQEMAKEFSQHYAIIASVVPKLTPLFRNPFKRRLHLVTTSSPGLHLRFDYPKPCEIGADRLVAAVAVHEDGYWPVIVIQCGTATAFTVLDTEGRLCGGVIAPGLNAQLASLIGATAQLPDTDLRLPARFLARSTEEAVRAGVMLNFQGGAKEILRGLIRELPAAPPPRIVLTGGNAGYLTGSLDLPHTLRPLLVFEGLRMIGTWVFREPLLYIEE